MRGIIILKLINAKGISYMELLQLTYFCHAAECENFSKTAEHFNVPTSNISRAIRSLESELGEKLFIRSANKVFLNEKGENFYRFISQSLKLIENGKAAVSGINSAPRGKIKLLISSCRRIATEAVERCRKSYPEISFSIKHGFDDGNYDFVIADAPREKKQFNKTKLLSEKMFLAVPADSPLSKNAKSDVSFENEPFITLGKGTRLHALTELYCNSLGFTPTVALETDDPQYVKKYLEMGLGVALFPEKSWAQMKSKKIKLLDVGFPERRIYVFYDKSKELSSAEKAFLDILIPTFKDI